ncbi:energy transducer TonB [Alishewanella sp. 16-MA]|uniref:Energy transducer TonB n=1 Tax=Alishewanella maricola TaxID=2795740 RepID=A0ABS8C535_9ALTE|nr:energy transducer TonB [Alishewanella maricola]MCB5227454.1 energy transducer TonB [Alishewanella maricola]
MKKIVCISVLSVLLIGCKANDSVQSTDHAAALAGLNYLNLTAEDKKDLLDEYWIAEKKQEPRYPLDAAFNQLSGCVDMLVGIDKDGKATAVSIITSFPKGIFDANAIEALSHWQWVASAKNSAKQPVLTSIKFDFTVSGSKNLTKAEQQCDYVHTVD